jgi:hypothetical protein
MLHSVFSFCVSHISTKNRQCSLLVCPAILHDDLVKKYQCQTSTIPVIESVILPCTYEWKLKLSLSLITKPGRCIQDVDVNSIHSTISSLALQPLYSLAHLRVLKMTLWYTRIFDWIFTNNPAVKCAGVCDFIWLYVFTFFSLMEAWCSEQAYKPSGLEGNVEQFHHRELNFMDACYFRCDTKRPTYVGSDMWTVAAI